MKSIITTLALMLSLSSFASSGASTVSLVLTQPEVEKLDNDLAEKGFTLSKIVDNYATKGVAPRCPCTSMELTFTKVSAGKATTKSFGVSTQGFGTSLKVTISPVK